MATSVEAKLIGESRKDNYTSNSDSDVDGEGANVDEVPSTVMRPAADGLPQVSEGTIRRVT